jgi:uridine kinase
MSRREQLVSELAQKIDAIARPHPVRVAIDGVDASGKTTLADELARQLVGLGRTTIRASVDGFHNPASVRKRRGPDSPEGYFLDSFNYAQLTEKLISPLGPGGNRRFRRKAFDYRTDSVVDAPHEFAVPDSILLFDGVFLLRPELRDFWDFSVFVEVDFETILARAEIRDAAAMGGAAEVRRRYQQRYIPGQWLYLSTCRPQAHTSVIVQNHDPAEPSFAVR